MTPTPSIDRISSLASPRGVVLMLHGGAEHNLEPVPDRSKSLWRSRVMYSAIRGRLESAGLAVALLRFGTIGWNDPEAPSPVPDARWALDQLRARWGSLPTALLGHSMGARTAFHVADDPDVIGLVGLAPWFPADEEVAHVTGKHVIGAHGSRDRITRASATRALLLRTESVAASTRFVDMGPVGHYMLRRRREWDRLAATSTLTLFD